MATLKAKRNAHASQKPMFKLDKKHIVTSIVGGALLYFAYKRRSTALGKLASVAGTSLLGRGLNGAAGSI